ncbi:MAG: HDOD domain-containing protein [Desulfobacula sp.]|uniref:HDOD domain-containing protein n=1 Tax=Desulfobacula sp. TaxID=2593537 RepID=UPI0025B81148|nr:HDOD domain-containing protein [Desulfobacula sp.]MCD4718832.1 HDOD domain-containing protein [Desulfobacula sp.]
MAAAFYRDLDPEDLPVPDRRVMQLIQYVLRDDAQIDILTQLISVNPALTAQLLGLVNSAFFGFRQNVKTISDAVVAVGMESLRNLVLCFAVKEALSKNKIPGFDIDTFWEDSIRRAVAAKQLAYLVNEPVEEAFTAGMLQDIGLLVLFFMEPEKVDRWPLLRSNLPQQRHEMEEELFHTAHDSVGAMLTKKWNLPKSYILAIGYHHLFFDKKETQKYRQAKNHSVLAEMLHLSDLCNAVYTCYDKSGALTALKKQSKRLFALAGDKVDSLLSSLPGLVEEISSALNITIGSQINFDSVMEQVNRKLVDDNISYHELTWQLQNSLKQRDQYAAKLEAELDIAREIQQSLQPDIEGIHQVGAFNIPAFHLSGDFYDYFAKEDGTICFCLGDVSGKGTSAALLMAKAISLFRCLCKVVNNISEIVQLMNNELCETAVRGMFVTFVGGWLHPESNRLDIINVGHLPPFLVNDKAITRIEATDPPLGILPGVLHPAKQFSIKNSRLYLYTDGFTEGRLKNGKTKDPGNELGLKGFLRWLIQSGKMPLDEQMAWIKGQCRTQLAPQSDDLTLMILSGE